MTAPTSVALREVGPRDGLQAEAPVAVGKRVALIEALAATGVSDIEAVAFVSPRAVPAMAGAAEVLSGLRRRPGVRYWALVPNVRGAEMALDAAVDGISVTVSASEGYSGKNVGMTVQQSVAEAGRIVARAAGRVPVDAVISCAFGSPFEGDIEADFVADLARRLLDGGATQITLADTTGMATPPGSTRCSTRWAARQRAAERDSTSTTPGGRRWSTPTPPCSEESPGSTAPSGAWAARPLRPARAATWPPRTSSTSWMISAFTPVSTWRGCWP